MMTKESIQAVSPERSVYLLTDKHYQCLGRKADLLTPSELQRLKPAYKTKMESIEDKLNAVEVINRNIDDMVEIMRRGCDFELLNRNDATLIFYCIDKFLVSQYHLSYGQATPDKLEDYADLEKLANYMLYLMDFNTRATMPNVKEPPKPKHAKEEALEIDKQQLVYNNLFGAKIDIRSTNLTVDENDEPKPDENESPKYINPFKNKLQRRDVNTLERFK